MSQADPKRLEPIDPARRPTTDAAREPAPRSPTREALKIFEEMVFEAPSHNEPSVSLSPAGVDATVNEPLDIDLSARPKHSHASQTVNVPEMHRPQIPAILLPPAPAVAQPLVGPPSSVDLAARLTAPQRQRPGDDQDRAEERGATDVSSAEPRGANNTRVEAVPPAPEALDPISQAFAAEASRRTRLTRLIDELGGSLQVSDKTRANQWAIRLRLKEEILPQTELQMSSNGHRLSIVLLTADRDTHRSLNSHRDTLIEALKERSKLAVAVDVCWVEALS
jgi:Type III secretion protein (HpaP)